MPAILAMIVEMLGGFAAQRGAQIGGTALLTKLLPSLLTKMGPRAAGLTSAMTSGLAKTPRLVKDVAGLVPFTGGQIATSGLLSGLQGGRQDDYIPAQGGGGEPHEMSNANAIAGLEQQQELMAALASMGIDINDLQGGGLY